MGCNSSKEGKAEPKSKGDGAAGAAAPSRAVSTGARRCHHCGKLFPLAEASGHTVVCEEREVTCHHSWCRKILKQKDLRGHMHDCQQSRRTQCPKCGETFAASELSAHRGICDVVQCEHCVERVIPRMIKYCPNVVLGKLQSNFRVGPFATERLRDKFVQGLSSPIRSSPASLAAHQRAQSQEHVASPLHPPPNGFAAPPNTGQAFSAPPSAPPSASHLTAGQHGPLAMSQSLTLTEGVSSPAGHMTRQISMSSLNQTQRNNINFQTARVQHLWRWAKAKAVLEDLMFRVVWKELDLKKETFSIFKAHDHRILDEEEQRARQKKLKSAAPVQAVEVKAGHYFPAKEDMPITVDILDRVIEDLSNKVPLPYHAVWRTMNDAHNILKACPNITRLSPPEGAKQVEGRWHSGGKVVVVGDLHGQLQDLLCILHEFGNPSERTFYVFNGDFVDRGKYGIEIVVILLLLLIVFPKFVALNRGNHECDYMNEEYGFDVEVQTKYDRNIFKLIQRCFCALPLATVVGTRTFIVHGGIPRNGDVTFDEIDAIQRFRQIPMPEHTQPEEDEIFQDLMWNDPREEAGWIDSERGVGAMFGPDVTKMFLKVNGLELVIRSHEEFQKGHEIHHGGLLMTVFSASNYDGPNSNMGATVTLMGDSSEYSIHTYRCNEEDFLVDDSHPPHMPLNESVAQTPQGFAISRTFSQTSLANTFVSNAPGGSQTHAERFGHFCASLLGNINFLALTHGSALLQPVQLERRTREDVVHEIRDRIYERRHRLLAYFTKIDRTQKGSVWKMEWVETMHQVLNLDLPWFFLRPFFTHTEPLTHRIRYVQFLARFKTGIAALWMPAWSTAAMADLYYRLFGRRRHPVAKALSEHTDPIGYNEFCGLVRQCAESITDSELFHLYVLLCDDGRDDVCFITGPRTVERLKAAADAFDTEAQFDENDSSYCGWDLITMDQLSNVINRLGSSLLHKIFHAKRDTPITTFESFSEGIATVAKGSKRPLDLRPSAMQAIWGFLKQHCVNQAIGVTVDEILLAFSVRDFTSLAERREMYQELTTRLLGDDASTTLRRRYSFTWGGFGPTPPAEFGSPSGASLAVSQRGIPGVTPKLRIQTPSQSFHRETPQPQSQSPHNPGVGTGSQSPNPPGASSSMQVSRNAGSMDDVAAVCGTSLADEDSSHHLRHSPDRSKKESPTASGGAGTATPVRQGSVTEIKH
jgi:diadenosine tetraphosphatase ApaH/serine/threonine PP2A family protein phosphatase